MTASDADTVIVGAGPYGLSVAAHLSSRGVEARVFGDTMGSWQQNMPAGMYLKSAARASSISAPERGATLNDYAATIGIPALTDLDAVPLDLFTRYGLWFKTAHVPGAVNDLVTDVATGGSGFEVTLASGETLRSRTVVAATGFVAFAHVPRELLVAAPEGPSVDGPVSHSSQHSGFAGLAGKRVIVVGSGQSAMETATLLAEAGAEAELIARAHELRWASPPPATVGALRRLLKPASDLGPGWSHRALSDAPGLVRYLPSSTRRWLLSNVLGPSGSFWLRDRFEGAVRVRLGRSLRRAEALPNGGVRLHLGADGSGDQSVEADHVIAGTGYRIDLDRISYLAPDLRARLRRTESAPALGASFQSSVNGLYFAGLAAAPTFGPYLRFVAGTRFAGPRIALAISQARARPATWRRRTA